MFSAPVIKKMTGAVAFVINCKNLLIFRKICCNMFFVKSFAFDKKVEEEIL